MGRCERVFDWRRRPSACLNDVKVCSGYGCPCAHTTPNLVKCACDIQPFLDRSRHGSILGKHLLCVRHGGVDLIVPAWYIYVVRCVCSV